MRFAQLAKNSNKSQTKLASPSPSLPCHNSLYIYTIYIYTRCMLFLPAIAFNKNLPALTRQQSVVSLPVRGSDAKSVIQSGTDQANNTLLPMPLPLPYLPSSTPLWLPLCPQFWLLLASSRQNVKRVLAYVKICICIYLYCIFTFSAAFIFIHIHIHIHIHLPALTN